MKYYPAFLEVKNKKCVVIGGGKVAERKVRALLKAEAKVCVISPHLTSYLRKLKSKKKFCYVNARYKKEFLKGAFLVIAATDDPMVNTAVYQDAVRGRMLINCVDSPLKSNFIVPAVFERGDLIIAISTSGKIPCGAKKVKDDLKKFIDDKYISSLKILEKVREKIKTKYSSKQRRKILNKLSKMSLSHLKQDTFVIKVLKGRAN